MVGLLAVGVVLGLYFMASILLIARLTRPKGPNVVAPFDDLTGVVEGPVDLSNTDEGREDTVYVASSRFLHDCHAYLVQRQAEHPRDEWLLLVTGSKHENTVHLDTRFAPMLEAQSAAYVRADPFSTRDILIDMHEYGEQLHAIFHSHRFTGPQTPSSTDEMNHRRHEGGRYAIITGIFSEDGYVTFWNTGRPVFTVVVSGKGVQPVDGSGKRFRLSAIGQVHNGFPQAKSPW